MQRHATWSLPETDTAVHFQSLTASNPITSVHASNVSTAQNQFLLAQLNCVDQRGKDQRQRHATWSLPEIDTAVHFQSPTASNSITSVHASCVSATQVFSCQYGQVSDRTVCVWGFPSVISPGSDFHAEAGPIHSSNSPLLFPRQQFCPMISRTNAPSKNTMQTSGRLTPFYPNRRSICHFIWFQKSVRLPSAAYRRVTHHC